MIAYVLILHPACLGLPCDPVCAHSTLHALPWLHLEHDGHISGGSHMQLPMRNAGMTCPGPRAVSHSMPCCCGRFGVPGEGFRGGASLRSGTLTVVNPLCSQCILCVDHVSLAQATEL